MIRGSSRTYLSSRTRIGLVLATAMFVVGAVVPPAVAAPKKQKSDVLTFTTPPVAIDGAKAELWRTGDSVSFRINARELQVGHATTVWAVIFNDPGDCSAPGCGEDDIFIDGHPDNGLNLPQIEAAEISVLWSGAGEVTGHSKTTYRSGFAEGSPPGQVLFGPGLADAQGAEIHFVIRDHGPASSDPATLEAQLTTFEGGCDGPDLPPHSATGEGECSDWQFAVFAPQP